MLAGPDTERLRPVLHRPARTQVNAKSLERTPPVPTLNLSAQQVAISQLSLSGIRGCAFAATVAGALSQHGGRFMPQLPEGATEKSVPGAF